jgi:hypothetical protein|tara:strand:- start:260 stop:475 length:216 start_codon:yes stop_codon:yes gene_type:complete
MRDKIEALKRLSPVFREIAQKWEERQKIEESLGIPTSDALTYQFIIEDLPENLGNDILKNVKETMGMLYGR